MANLRVLRISLITLQLVSMTIASVIIIVHYNPWIERIINEAERSGNTSQSLADQIGRIEGEEIVIFLMSTATILVSLIGIIGTLRGDEHNHCLLNFYMSTLIIFLFVIFMALCGTIWEVISKIQYQSSFDSTYHMLQANHLNISNNVEQYRPPESTVISTNTTLPKSAQSSVTWWYIGKSFLFISFCAALYSTSLRLTRKILESSDDRYLSANDHGDEEDLNSEAGRGEIQHFGVILGMNCKHIPYSNHSFNNNFQHNITDAYNHNMISKSGVGAGSGVASITSTGIGSPFRNI